MKWSMEKYKLLSLHHEVGAPPPQPPTNTHIGLYKWVTMAGRSVVKSSSNDIMWYGFMDFEMIYSDTNVSYKHTFLILMIYQLLNWFNTPVNKCKHSVSHLFIDVFYKQTINKSVRCSVRLQTNQPIKQYINHSVHRIHRISLTLNQTVCQSSNHSLILRHIFPL